MTQAAAEAYDTLIQFLYQAPIGLLQTTLDGEITMINPMSAQLLMPMVSDGNLLNLFDALATAAPNLRALAAAAEAPGSVICDGLRVEYPSAGSPQEPQKILALRLLRLDQATLVASVADITASVQRESQRLAVHLHDATRSDPLTALPNRVVAMERIAHALTLARADPAYLFAVLFVDCDRFDRINTTLGAQAGDELLRSMGGRLNATVRHGDGVGATRADEPAVARLGSDQFVLVLQGMRDAADARGVAQRVVDALAKPFAIEERLVHVTASVGVVLRPQAVGDPEEVLLSASIAMHEAKRAGGARFFLFEPGMKERASRLGTLESDLRRGLAEKQLFVVYQPIVGMASGTCVAVEALVRWRHPERGIVPPVEFIGVAEETGLITALGEFVLREACWQLAAWRRALGALAPRTVCVNLSRAQLLGGAFPAQVREALLASGLAPQHLQLEVTESLAAQDADVIAQLHQLKAIGVSLALDDFGTGYSSLSSLHQLPVDLVKIDRSFVCQVESSTHHRVLIEATVMVAKSLGMSTVAEGIETAGQFAQLRALRCDKGQGYLFSAPLPADAACEWLMTQEALA